MTEMRRVDENKKRPKSLFLNHINKEKNMKLLNRRRIIVSVNTIICLQVYYT